MDDKGNPVEGVAPRPAYASGGLDLNVPPLSRTLDVTATVAAEKVDPGAQTSVSVQVKDSRGQAGGGRRAGGGRGGRGGAGVEQLPAGRPDHDLLHGARVGDEHASMGGRASCWPTRRRWSRRCRAPTCTGTAAGGVRGGGPGSGRRRHDGVGGDAGADGAAGHHGSRRWRRQGGRREASTPIAVRTNFNPLALFAPDVRTDAEGRATVEYKLPDNLTRYRVMVVAATEKDFGSAEANVTARLPLMVRPSAPRFLNFGDRFQFPIVLQNQTDEPMTVDVAIDTANLAIEGAAAGSG